jgi:hypothetical protein
MRGRFYACIVYIAAMMGVLLSLVIREKFDGVAFLFVIIAASAFFVRKCLEKNRYFEGVDGINASIDAEHELEEHKHDYVC